MNRASLVIVAAIATPFAASGCGQNEQWVSVPLMSCPGKDWNDIKKNASFQKTFGAARCGKAGKSYAADWRCEKGVIEVKCQ